MCLQREASLDELVVANFTDCFSLPDLEHEYNINCHFNTLQAALIPQLGLYQLESNACCDDRYVSLVSNGNV